MRQCMGANTSFVELYACYLNINTYGPLNAYAIFSSQIPKSIDYTSRNPPSDHLGIDRRLSCHIFVKARVPEFPNSFLCFRLAKKHPRIEKVQGHHRNYHQSSIQTNNILPMRVQVSLPALKKLDAAIQTSSDHACCRENHRKC